MITSKSQINSDSAIFATEIFRFSNSTSGGRPPARFGKNALRVCGHGDDQNK
jgi:hypothetical protein